MVILGSGHAVWVVGSGHTGWCHGGYGVASLPVVSWWVVSMPGEGHSGCRASVVAGMASMLGCSNLHCFVRFLEIDLIADQAIPHVEH